MLTGVKARHPKVMQATLRIGTLQERAQEQRNRMMAQLHNGEPKPTANLRVLRKLGHPWGHLLRPGNWPIRKEEVITKRREIWENTLNKTKTPIPQGGRLPPFLKNPDVHTTRWIYRWYLHQAVWRVSKQTIESMTGGALGKIRHLAAKEHLTTEEEQELLQETGKARGAMNRVLKVQQRQRNERKRTGRQGPQPRLQQTQPTTDLLRAPHTRKKRLPEVGKQPEQLRKETTHMGSYWGKPHP